MAHAIYLKVQRVPEALRVALMLATPAAVDATFLAAADAATRQQLAHMLARAGWASLDLEAGPCADAAGGEAEALKEARAPPPCTPADDPFLLNAESDHHSRSGPSVSAALPPRRRQLHCTEQRSAMRRSAICIGTQRHAAQRSVALHMPELRNAEALRRRSVAHRCALRSVAQALESRRAPVEVPSVIGLHACAVLPACGMACIGQLKALG